MANRACVCVYLGMARHRECAEGWKGGGAEGWKGLDLAQPVDPKSLD